MIETTPAAYLVESGFASAIRHGKDRVWVPESNAYAKELGRDFLRFPVSLFTPLSVEGLTVDEHALRSLVRTSRLDDDYDWGLYLASICSPDMPSEDPMQTFALMAATYEHEFRVRDGYVPAASISMDLLLERKILVLAF